MSTTRMVEYEGVSYNNNNIFKFSKKMLFITKSKCLSMEQVII